VGQNPHEIEDHMAEFKRLPSFMAMEAAGDHRPLIGKVARDERLGLRRNALRDQTFSILWDRHGTGDDDDRDIAWTWFNLWPSVSAGISKIGNDQPSATSAADFVDETHFRPNDSDSR
jgi:hypothetical protein